MEYHWLCPWGSMMFLNVTSLTGDFNLFCWSFVDLTQILTRLKILLDSHELTSYILLRKSLLGLV